MKRPKMQKRNGMSRPDIAKIGIAPAPGACARPALDRPGEWAWGHYAWSLGRTPLRVCLEDNGVKSRTHWRSALPATSSASQSFTTTVTLSGKQVRSQVAKLPRALLALVTEG